MIDRHELIDGLKQGALLGAAVLVLVVPPWRKAPAPAAVAPAIHLMATARQVDFRGEPATSDVHALAQWVVQAGDNGPQPFAIVDKRDARVYVFDPQGGLRGATPVLLGHAAGDDSVPGIGQRPIDQVRPEERTTPAGRFVAESGRNTMNEEVLWVDYDAAVSMHRVRLTNPAERRLERLASPDASQRRISYGCINMPVAFFDDILWPSFAGRRGVIYVLPETRPLESVFPSVRVSSRLS